MVVLNKEDYIDKAENLFAQWDANRMLKTNPTEKQKN